MDIAAWSLRVPKYRLLDSGGFIIVFVGHCVSTLHTSGQHAASHAQVESDALLLASGASEFAAQIVHAAEHMQSLISVLPSGEPEFAIQFVH